MLPSPPPPRARDNKQNTQSAMSKDGHPRPALGLNAPGWPLRRLCMQAPWCSGTASGCSGNAFASSPEGVAVVGPNLTPLHIDPTLFQNGRPPFASTRPQPGVRTWNPPATGPSPVINFRSWFFLPRCRKCVLDEIRVILSMSNHRRPAPRHQHIYLQPTSPWSVSRQTPPFLTARCLRFPV